MQCKAKSKRTGERCRSHAVRGWSVCRMHGARGGPKTKEGLNRCKQAPWKHGRYGRELKDQLIVVRKLLQTPFDV